MLPGGGFLMTRVRFRLLGVIRGSNSEENVCWRDDRGVAGPSELQLKLEGSLVHSKSEKLNGFTMFLESYYLKKEMI